MQVSIVIPNYNGLENLKRNLPKVIEATEGFSEETEIVVVDDASNDKSVDFLQSEQLKRLTVIPNKKNVGFAEGCNVGVKNAKGEIVVLLNSDVYPEINFLKYLMPHFQDEKVFAVSCLEKTLNEEDEIIGERGAGKIFFKDGLYQHSAGDLNSRETDWVCGGSGAFRRSIFLKLGGFDKNFAPFYWEDVDLSYRAKKAGYKLLFEKRSIVYHKHTEGAIKKKYSKQQIEKISFANQLKFTRKHVNSVSQFADFTIFLLKFYLKKIFAKDI